MDLEECQSKTNKSMEFMFRRFKEFLKHEKQTSRLRKQSGENLSYIPTCHQYGEKGRIRPNFPQNKIRNQN